MILKVKIWFGGFPPGSRSKPPPSIQQEFDTEAPGFTLREFSREVAWMRKSLSETCSLSVWEKHGDSWMDITEMFPVKGVTKLVTVREAA